MRTPPGSGEKKKIIIFGGAFDPIHQGHRSLLTSALNHIRPDQTILIPSNDHPIHKNPCLFPAHLRVAMINATLQSLRSEPFQILNYEINQRSTAYTWNTLHFLKRRYAQSQFYLLIGSDNVHDIRRWRNARELLGDKRLTLVAANRPGWTLSPILRPAGGLIKLPGKFPDISSSTIRKNLVHPDALMRRQALNSLDTSVRTLIFEEPFVSYLAISYIRQHLPTMRAHHSEAVGLLSQKLALKWGVDQENARLAGLLHDASRTEENFKNTNEALTHAQKSADLAKNIFHVKNPAILEAIRNHTLGRAGMGKLAQILYVADFASYDRNFPEAQEIRTIAEKNLSQALCLTAAHKLRYLLRQNQFIHPQTLAFWNSLVGKS